MPGVDSRPAAGAAPPAGGVSRLRAPLSGLVMYEHFLEETENSNIAGSREGVQVSQNQCRTTNDIVNMAGKTFLS